MNILFTSAGRRSYLIKYFKEVIKETGKIHVANSSNISAAFQAADKSVVTPLIYDENYVPFLLNYCKENNINAVISLFDIDLLILAQHKKEFLEIGVNLIVSDESVIEICNDKWNTYRFLCENKIETPKTFLNIDDVYKAVDKKVISYPVIVKPRWGMGSIAIYQADDEQELKIFYNKIKKEIFNTYLKYESVADVNNCVIIQEKLSGQEYGMDVINDLEGNYVNTVVKKKYAMRSGETDCAVTVDNKEAKALGEKISLILKHIANLDVDFFICNNKLYVLEMNARFGGGYPFSHMAGVNLPMAIMNWLRGEKVDKTNLIEQKNVMSQKDINIIMIKSL